MRVQPPLTVPAQPARWGLRKWCAQAALLLAVVGLASFAMSVRGQESSPSEYQVKAAYLVNFSKYVEWPVTAFAHAKAPLVIGICGDDKFGDDLKKMIHGKTINGHPFVVEHFHENQELKNACHILFISASEKRRIPEILEKQGKPGVLTVGETEGFLPQGGVINFTLKDKKVRLEISLEQAEKAGIKISSKLLSVAEVVKGKDH